MTQESTMSSSCLDQAARNLQIGFEYHTYPDDHGVTIVTGVSDIKTSRYFEDTYEWFDKNRSEVLHL